MDSTEPMIVQQALCDLKPTDARVELLDSMHVSVTVCESEQTLQGVLLVMGRFELNWDLSVSAIEYPLCSETSMLLAKVRNLHTLSLHAVDIGNADLARLGTRATIRRLTISPRVSLGSATEGIAALTSLEYLNVTGAGIDDEGLIKLRTLIHLREFVFNHSQVNSGLEFLVDLPEVKTIKLVKSQFGPDVMKWLKRLSGLEKLNLSGGPIAASAVQTLAEFPALCELSLSNCDLSAADLSLLLRHHHLQQLCLDNCSLNDQAFLHVPKHSDLKRLSLLNNHLSATCCQRLRQCLPECEIVIDNPQWLQNPSLKAALQLSGEDDRLPHFFDTEGFLHITVEKEADEFCRRFGSEWGIFSLGLCGASDRALNSLRGLPALFSLSLERVTEETKCPFTSEGLAALQAVPRLKSLSLDLPQPLGESLRHLSALPSLEELNLGESGDLGRYAVWLSELPKLRRLRLNGCLWRTHCVGLASFKTLEHLHMHSTEFKFEHLKGLAPPPALCELSLYSLPITDEGWDTLCAWKQLTTISLSGMTDSRLPLWKLLALPQVEEVTIDNCQLDLQSDRELPVGASLEKLSVTVPVLDEPEQELILQRLAQHPCAVTLSYDIKVAKIIHQLGTQRKIELIETVGGLDPSRPGTDYESANPPISPREAARRSIIRTFGGKLYVEAE